MSEHTIQELQMLQALPLNVKVEKTKQRIREWVDHFGLDGVYVSFSGGKDSTVLEKLKVTHPKQYAYIMKPVEEGGLGYKEVIDWINEHNGKGTIIRY